MTRNYENQSPTAFQRLPEYKREDDWIRDFLQEAKVGHIATVFDRQPFVNATTFWYDEKSHKVFFHSNVAGRIRTNVEQNPRVCLEASEMGKLLPSNVALEFTMQYRSAMVFGTARIVSDPQEARRALYGLIKKYFPTMTPGGEFREITDKELNATTVYEIQIEAWSGKENWKDQAEQSSEWKPLDAEWFDHLPLK